jgi:hypothetical protein
MRTAEALLATASGLADHRIPKLNEFHAGHVHIEAQGLKCNYR